MPEPLRDYQQTAVHHLHAQPRSALMMDMGLGKTACVLTALTDDHLPALVVAPKTVAREVWPEELEKWRPDLRRVHAVGTPAQRKELLARPADITVVAKEFIGEVPVDGPWKTVVLDELSGYKGRGVQWKRAMKLCAPRPYVWGMTGTPAPNGLLDLWAQVAILDKGQRLGRFYGKSFRDVWFQEGRRMPNGVVTRYDPVDGAEEFILKSIADICLSMKTDGRLQLPEQIFNEVTMHLAPNHRTVYDTMKNDMVVDLEDVLGYGEAHSASSAGVVGNKLAQITAGFLYVDDADLRGKAYSRLHRNKIEAVRRVVEETGSPVLVFYNYKPELEMLREEFGDDLPTPKNTKELQKRWNGGDLPILASHPASIGHGLNLQNGPGHTSCWTTPTQSLEWWEQGLKRLHRSGQQNPVMNHLLITEDTVDPVIYEALHAKSSVQEALMTYLESPV